MKSTESTIVQSSSSVRSGTWPCLAGTSQRGRTGLLWGIFVVTLLFAFPGVVIGHQSNQITQISPNSAQPGTANLLVTFSLDTDFPPPPPAGDGPFSVMIGNISGTSITHTSPSTVTAIFSFASGEPTGAKDVAIAFSVPGDTLVFSLAGGFTVGSGGTGEEYNIERTLSDLAQRNTIAFDGLGFLTGSLGGQSFLPPGKVADYSGFQYLRDNDPTALGHNTSFVTIVAYNVLHILTTDQINQMVTRAQSQIDLINEYAYQRFPLMKSFRRLLDGELPTGSTGLNKDSVMAYSARLYEIDGEISYDRAKLMGGVVRSLTTAQRASLDNLKTLGGVGNWDSTLTDPLQGLQLPQDVGVAVMTYASEMYAWYAGSVAADVYFCPERQGTYFGSFYLKDWPAMGNPNYTINDQLTARAGESFLSILTTSQAAMITGLVDSQKAALYELVDRRQDISTQLRLFMTQETIDSAAVMSLSAAYGRLDGDIVYRYASTFASVGNALNVTQQDQLTALADSLGYVPASGAFLYSQPIPMPEIANTDFLFGAATAANCGDADGSGSVNISDAVYLISYIFGGGPAPSPLGEGDADQNGAVNISDAVYLIAYIFAGGPAPCASALDFTLASASFQDGGELAVIYTCAGAGTSPALEWTGAPEGTTEFAVMMTTMSLDGPKWNWVLYNIPSNVTSIAENTTGVGMAGLSSDGPELRYYPPCPQGPGPKTYTFTVYALSGAPLLGVPAEQVTGAILTDASNQLILASSQMTVTYTPQ